MKFTSSLILLAAAPSMIMAQAGDERVEKIEITGSYIKRVDLEGAQPIQTIDREYLDQTGYNSVSDVLREMSANSFGSRRERSGSSIGGTSGVSLRGLGESRTLVLLNGRRLAKDGISGSVDLNLIPMAAVERIDILKDSSSALYGSDALGGVVNIITKKDYVGGEVSIRHEMPEENGGERSTVSGLYGFGTDKLNVISTLQYRKNQKIWSRDREWSDDGESTYSPTPNVDSGSGFEPADDACAGGVYSAEEDQCLFDYTSFSTELPTVEQVNLLSNVRYEIDGLTEVHALVNATHKTTWYRYAPGAVQLSDVTDPNTSTNYDTVKWRSLVLGPRDTEMTTKSIGVNTGVRRYIGDTWEADLTVGTQRIERNSESPSGYAVGETLISAIESGDCNIFTPGAPCNLPSGTKYEPWQETKSRLDYVELRTNGELFDLPAGPLSAAVGGQHTYETYTDKYDPLSLEGGVAGGGAGSEGAGTRHVTAAFAELAIPVIRGLDVQVAGRYDKYSDFGDTFNPKVSLMYKPISEILFRASAGTGFKAPNMTDLYASASAGSPTFLDEKACLEGVAGACKPQQYRAVSGGNDGLKEEKSTSYTVGTVIQATKDFSIGIDYWNIEMENVVGLNYRGVTRAEARNGRQWLIDNYGITVDRDANGRISEINSKLLNLDERKLSGVDFSLQYNGFIEKVGSFTLRNEFSYMIEFENQLFPGLGSESAFDYGGAPRWRNNLTVNYGPTQDLNFTAMFITTAKNYMSLNPTTREHDRYQHTYTRVDLQGSYNIASIDSSVSIGIKNLLGLTPPLDHFDINNQLNYSLYDNIGRRIFANYTYRF